MLIDYYLFQKEIKEYLTDWKDKEDNYRKKVGYLVNPDWLREWKKLIKYDEQLFYLKEFQIESTKLTKDQIDLVDAFISSKIDDLKINSIKVNASYSLFKSKSNFFSLTDLENFINEDTYIKGMKAIKIKYVFKKKMLILFFDLIKTIKIIYFYEKENKLTNLKFSFDTLEVYNGEKNHFLVTSKSQEIIDFLECNKIFDLKLYDNYDTNLKRKTYKIIYEENEKNEDDNENDDENEIRDRRINTFPEIKNEKEEAEKGGFQLKRLKTFSEKEFMSFVKDKKIFSVNFRTPDQNVVPITCKYNMKFSKIEKLLFKERPEFKKSNISYIANGQKVKLNLTCQENKIKAGDQIIMIINENENDK